MSFSEQQEKAERLRQWHHEPPMLVLPNVWDAASARVIEQVGCRAIATTSSGVAAALGYPDGQRISREMAIEALARITRVVKCPVTADIEAGYGQSIDDVLQTVTAVIGTGAVGINIEDSLPHQEGMLADFAYQVELIAALRRLANSMDVPLVINARVDVFLQAIGAPASRFEQTVERANAYLQAGADCIYPIGLLEPDVIANLVKAINGPINIMGGPPAPALPELARFGVARVSLASEVMRSVLGYLRKIAQELLENGTYTSIQAVTLSNAEFKSLLS